MTQEINKYVNAEPWYGKIWAKFKQFPGYLAEGSQNPPKVSGSAAAALISAGIGCFGMMVSHHFSDADKTKAIEKMLLSFGSWIPGTNNPDEMWGNIGSYSGKETVMLVFWLISWAILHFTWKDKNIKGNTIIFWLLTLMVAATAMSWHPLFPYLPLV